ncbi:hypothetical protein U1Q18_018916 [Sarracenia purpurea var. burkii]
MTFQPNYKHRLEESCFFSICPEEVIKNLVYLHFWRNFGGAMFSALVRKPQFLPCFKAVDLSPRYALSILLLFLEFCFVKRPLEVLCLGFLRNGFPV